MGDLQPMSQRKPFTAVLIVIACTLASVVNSANTMSMTMLMPTIGREIGIPQNRQQWLMSAYPLSSGCLLLVFGRLADTHGRKRVFILGALWSVIFTLGCAFGRSSVTIDVLRAMQGVGSAAMIPASLGILAHSFPPSRERSFAFSAFSAGGPIGAGFGMILGGVLSEVTSETWRSSFYLSCGLTVLCLLCGVVSIDADVFEPTLDKRIDWVGAVLVTSGLVSLVVVLGQGQIAPQQWRTPYILVLLVLGVVLVALFFMWESHLEKEFDNLTKVKTTWNPPPLMRVSLWKYANGRLAVMLWIVFLVWASFVSLLFWMQLYLQGYLRLSPIQTVVRLLPNVLSGIVWNVVVAFLVGRIPFNYIITLGIISTSAACLLLALIVPSASYWTFLFIACIISVLGVDFVFSAGSIFIAKVVQPEEQSLAGGLFQTMMQIGTAFGITITTVVFDRVDIHERTRLGITETSLISYKGAFWGCFGFGIAALLLAVISFGGVGVVGYETRSKSIEGESETGNSIP